MNKTEIQKVARDMGIELSKQENKEVMYALIESFSDSENTLVPYKEEMERHIQKYIRRLKSQLPDCPGKCTSHGCPDGIVARCWEMFKDHLV